MTPRVHTPPTHLGHLMPAQRGADRELKISPERSQALDRLALSRSATSPLSPGWAPASLAPLAPAEAVADQPIGPRVDRSGVVGPIEAAQAQRPPPSFDDLYEVIGPGGKRAPAVSYVPDAEELRARNVSPVLKSRCLEWTARLMIGNSYRNIPVDARAVFRDLVEFRLPTVTLSAIKAACGNQDGVMLGFLLELLRSGGMNHDDPQLHRAAFIVDWLQQQKAPPFGRSPDRIISVAEGFEHMRRILLHVQVCEHRKDPGWARQVAECMSAGLSAAAADQLVFDAMMSLLESSADQLVERSRAVVGPSVDY